MSPFPCPTRDNVLAFVADLRQIGTIVTSSKEPLNQVEMLEQLADVLVENGLHEISLEQDGVRLELHAPAPATPGQAGVTTSQVVATQQAALGAPTPAEDDSLTAITSPMVGVFYRSPSPSDPSFVEVGDRVEVGQTVGLVEAMKVFNEIASEVEGVVVAIYAQNSDLVESGSSLMLVRPEETRLEEK
ncbi:MAG: acetyl-CoA carboxylase biotin carboxyl carrier protein [Abditibacteriaceae bacterium]